MKVQVYSAAWCRDCRAAKQFLDANGIAYTEINVDADPLPPPKSCVTSASAPFRKW